MMGRTWCPPLTYLESRYFLEYCLVISTSSADVPKRYIARSSNGRKIWYNIIMPSNWSKGQTKETNLSVRKISDTMKSRKLDNFKVWEIE